MKGILLLFAGLFLLQLNAQSLPQYDLSFNDWGTVSTLIQRIDKSNAIVVQPDKKIILAGNSTGHPIYGPHIGAMVRYNENGSLDNSFGQNGILKFDDLSCSVMALQNDGKILVAGQFQSKIGVARLMPDGSMDFLFGNEGIFSFGNHTISVSDIVILDDESIIVVGTILNAISNTSLIIKIKSNGQLDTTFGNEGVIMSQFGFNSVFTRKILLTTDGKFLIGGSASVNAPETPIGKLLIGRFNSDGTIDSSFGENGFVLHDSSTKSLVDFDFTTDGKIVAVGNIDTNSMGTFGDFIVTRFHADGSLDDSFGENNGYTRTSFDRYADYVTTIKILPNNEIYVGGSFWKLSYTSGFLCKYDSNGILDENFGNEGVFSTFRDRVTGIDLTPDMKMVLTAQSRSTSVFLASRLNVGLPFDGENFLEVKLISNPEDGGTLIGGGYYNSGDVVTGKVYPKPGSVFNNWTDNGNIVSTDTDFTFNIFENKELTANFTLLQYPITTSSSPEIGGTTSGGGNFYYGDNVTLNAIPNEDYVFDNWTDNGNIISTYSNFSFQAEGGLDLVANFSLKTYEILTSSFPNNSGTITGSGNYEIGEIVSLIATPNIGYTFVNWTENDIEISTDSNYQFEITENRNLTANFSQNIYTVSTTSLPEIGGTVTGDGSYNYGQIATLSANPNAEYNFLNWTENGIEVSNQINYDFEVTGDRNVVANFSINNYEISTISLPEIGGTVTGDGNYNYGQTATLTATANEEYNFINWTENGIEVSNQLNYEFEVTGDRNIAANFSINKYMIEITSSPTEGGIIEGAGEYDYGQSVNLFAIANEGYDFINWTENGNEVSNENEYDFVIESNRNLQANFEMQMSTADLSNNSIIILPNPFDKFIQIKSMDSVIQRLQLFTLSGELLLDKIISNQAEFKLNTETVAKGIYILKVYYQSEIETFKVIKK